MSDIASIEVFKGPQGTFGRNAMGGIIDIHTFSPLEYQNTKIKIGYGNKNDITAQASSYLKLARNLWLLYYWKLSQQQNDDTLHQCSNGQEKYN